LKPLIQECSFFFLVFPIEFLLIKTLLKYSIFHYLDTNQNLNFFFIILQLISFLELKSYNNKVKNEKIKINFNIFEFFFKKIQFISKNYI
jgi:positive regulator of sigma E activity